MNKALSTVTVALGVLVAGTAVANAQQSANQNPVSGFYVGGVLGYDNYSLNSSATLPTYGVSGAINGLGADGVAGGAIVGYNIPLGPQFIAGIEGSFRYSDADVSTTVTGLGSAGAKARESWGLGARVGFVPVDNVMLYASGGWTQGRFKTEVANAAGTTIYSGKDSQDAWRIGGGVEAALGSQWTARMDYTYANYSNYDIALSNTDSVFIKPTSHQVSLAISRYF